MKLKITVVIITFLITNFIFADSTTDEIITNKTTITKKIKFREKTKSFMKFRGDTYIGFRYYPAIHDGITNTDHTATNNYNPIDYTNAGDPSNQHHTKSPGRVVGNTWGSIELGLYADYSFIAPFLTGKNPLIKENNIKLKFSGGLTPISTMFGMSVTFTPIAFLEFEAGFTIGTGWNFAGLFNGIGINDGTHGYGYNQSFLGPVLQIWFAPTFQFDLAALMPKSYKRWTHVVLKLTPKFLYEGVLNIPENVSYQYEADYGQNMNGWDLYGDFLIGYQIPIIQDYTGNDRAFIKMRNNNFKITVIMSLQIDWLRLTHYFDSTIQNGGWGSDFCYLDFGPGAMFDLPNNLFAILLFQWRNDIKYTNQTVGNNFYQDRVYEDWYVFFYRITFAFGWNF